MTLRAEWLEMGRFLQWACTGYGILPIRPTILPPGYSSVKRA
jgi:hypothetical protein